MGDVVKIIGKSKVLVKDFTFFMLVLAGSWFDLVALLVQWELFIYLFIYFVHVLELEVIFLSEITVHHCLECK